MVSHLQVHAWEAHTHLQSQMSEFKLAWERKI